MVKKLDELPIEVFTEHIFNYCRLEELCVLSYTSSCFYDVVEHFLDDTVKISYRNLCRSVRRRIVSDAWLIRLLELEAFTISERYRIDFLLERCCRCGRFELFQYILGKYKKHFNNYECFREAALNGRNRIVEYILTNFLNLDSSNEYGTKTYSCKVIDLSESNFQIIREVLYEGHFETARILIRYCKSMNKMICFNDFEYLVLPFYDHFVRGLYTEEVNLNSVIVLFSEFFGDIFKDEYYLGMIRRKFNIILKCTHHLGRREISIKKDKLHAGVMTFCI